MLGDAKDTLTAGLADGIREQLSPLFEGMMKALYRQKGAEFSVDILASDEAQAFIGAHSSILDSTFRQTEMSNAMRERLQRSDYIFSGLKAFHEMNEAFPSLLDENGNRKSFKRFLDDVQSIDKTYNQNYLRAEYNFVHSSAEMAAKWEGFMEDGDRYNLQYRTAGDGKVRPEHAALNGVTLPPSDPFWSEYYPPNGWNCRCTVVQVRKTKYPETDREEAMARGEEALQRDTKGIFHFNPGKEQKTVPDYNPYTIRRCRNCDRSKLKLARFVPDSELCAACQLIRTCEKMRHEDVPVDKGHIEISSLVNRNDSDFNKLMDAAHHFASLGKEVMLTPKMTRPSKFEYDCFYGDLKGTQYYGKCPDLKIGDDWYEHEGFVTQNPKRAFANMMKDGLIQASRLIIDRPDLNEHYMKRSIYKRIQDGKNIQEVWFREPDGSLTLFFKRTEG